MQMGGHFLSDWWLEPHDPRTLPFWAHYFRDPHKPIDAKVRFMMRITESGNLLDRLTGIQGLAERLRNIRAEHRAAHVPPDVRGRLPELSIRDWALPSAFIHGAADSIVPVDDSKTTAFSLERLHVDQQLDVVPHYDHNLQLAADAPEGAGSAGQLAKARFCEFITKHLSK